MNHVIEKMSHIGDIFAIPFFALLVYYFSNMEHKTTMEFALFLFSISGLVLDVIFTYFYLHR